MKRFLSSILASFTKSSKSRRPASAERKASLSVENLEGRDLMSAAPLAVPSAPLNAAVKTAAPVAPAAPANFKFNLSNTWGTTTVNFTWSLEAGVKQYWISKWTGSTWHVVAQAYAAGPVGKEGWNTTVTSDGGTYTYKIQALSTSGVLSNASTVSFVSYPGIIGSAHYWPTAVSKTSETLAVNWASSQGATSYVIDVYKYVGLGKIFVEEIKTTATSRSLTLPPAAYDISIGAVNSTGTVWQQAIYV
jgi:hypothetical protein